MEIEYCAKDNHCNDQTIRSQTHFIGQFQKIINGNQKGWGVCRGSLEIKIRSSTEGNSFGLVY